MVEDPEKARHWRYFLLLEEDLDRSFRYVEPTAAQSNVYSLEFSRQLVAICAQFETVSRLLCAERLSSAPRDIEEIRSETLKIEQNLCSAEAVLMWQAETISPFSGWSASAAPGWWTAYNKVKHDPGKQIASATLENVKAAAAALGLVTLIYVGIMNTLGPTRLFDLSWVGGRT